jgi:hypothetical protein
MALEMTWENVGSAPPYKPYPLGVYLTDEAGSVVAQWQLNADVRSWLPGETTVAETVTVPSGLAPGRYDLRLALVWPGTQNPAIALAIEGRDAQGRYLLSAIQVGN